MAEDVGNIGGLLTPREDYVPRIQSAYGAIIQNAPDYQYFTAPLSNQGRNTATYGGQNNIVVAPDTPIRVVNNATGEVIYSGVGYEGAQTAIDAANALSASTGRKADWDIQVTRPGGTTFESVSTDRPDDMLSDIAGMALPIAVNFIPGLQGVGAVLANAAAGAGGAAIAGNDPLKGAIMGGLTSAGTQFLGPVVQSADGVATNLGRAVGAGAGATAGGLVTGRSLENSLLGGAIAGGSTYLSGELFGPKNLASDDLVTQNINRALSGLENGLIEAGAFGPDLLTAAYKGQGAFNPDGTQVTNWPGGKVPSYTNTTMAGDTVVTANVSGNAATTGSSGSSPAITVTGTGANTTNTKAADTKNDGPPITVTGATTTTKATDTKADTTTNRDGTIVVTGTQNTPKFDSDGTYKGDLTYIPSLVDDLVQQEQSGDTKDKDKKVTDTISDVIKYAGTAGTIYDLINRLLGGGGDGTVPGVPYTSPFGGGATLNLGGRTQINPNIADYERYGFGPEALFFSQGQNIPYVPPVTTAPATSTAAKTTTTGGATTTTGGATTTTGGATTTTTTPWTAPPGFTGVGPNTKVGDKQVVDGKTYVWGGDGVGWQWLATNNNGQQVLMPGNGATNVSSIDAMMKSGVMRPANEAETARLAEIDRIMAEASAAKTAAEATKINPGTAYFNIDTATADALGDRGLIGDVMSIQELQQAMAARELTDPNKYATNLYQQIGEQLSGGLLNIDQARAIQQQIQQELVRSTPSTQNMQNIFNTAMQQYKPLI